MKRPKVLILRAAGTNCDRETEWGFRLAGGNPERVHINRLIEGTVHLNDYQILVIPGGFSYGDDLSAGKVLANELRFKLKEAVVDFADSGRPIIGICNGFQVLVKAGFLPFSDGLLCATLTCNDSGHFEDRWVYLRCVSRSPLLAGLEDEVLFLPVAHAEGKFLTRTTADQKRLVVSNQIAFQYAEADGTPAYTYPANPNGSVLAIAGITNPAGNILGMMPHPERFLTPYLHPTGTRRKKVVVGGLQLLRSFVQYARG